MYRKTHTEIVQRLTDGAFIPPDLDNKDYVEYLAWVEEGNTPEDYIPPTPPTSRVLTVLQFRDRLTPAEEISITEAGMTNSAVRVWLDRLAAAQEVNLDDPRVIAGLETMTAAGLLASGRAEEIIA